jgi:hypothetical protein
MAENRETTQETKSSPKHGSSPAGNVDQQPQQHGSMSQADGTAAGAPRGETQAQPQVKSETPENRTGKLNPSAPNNATSEMPTNTTRDSAGEVGDPSGRGTLDAPREAEATVSDITGPGPSEKSPSTEGAGDLRRKQKDDSEAA